MSNYQVLVLSTSEEQYETFSEIRSCDGLEVIGIAENVRDADLFLEKFNADAIVVELASPTMETYEFIDRLSFLPKRPLVAVISCLREDSYYIRAKRMGAKLIYRSPYNLATVAEELYSALKNERRDTTVSVRVASDKSLDERLANIFISSGIPPHIKGYQFLREAVKQSVKIPAMINNITKQLYPAVAEKFDTSPSKVERAIRHAIEVAWSRGKIENINSIYGIKVFAKGDKPTNGELIALVSDKIIIECS
ncbi:MAG: sporulation initiation factor Spo0A C-terminal domain-containing protein [Clostridia bacterium]